MTRQALARAEECWIAEALERKGARAIPLRLLELEAGAHSLVRTAVPNIWSTETSPAALR